MNFAYNNYELIDLLKERGFYITACDWENVNATESKITNLIMNKDGTVNEKKYQ